MYPSNDRHCFSASYHTEQGFGDDRLTTSFHGTTFIGLQAYIKTSSMKIQYNQIGTAVLLLTDAFDAATM